MTDNTELKRAASAAKNWGGEVGEGRWYTTECFKRPYFSIPDAEFIAACEPGAVLALIAENDRLNAENKQLILLECYGGTAQAAINLLAERDQLKAELEKAELIGRIACNFDGYKAVLDERDQLKAENEELATAMSEILRVTPMGLEAFGIAALALGELGVNKEVQS